MAALDRHRAGVHVDRALSLAGTTEPDDERPASAVSRRGPFVMAVRQPAGGGGGGAVGGVACGAAWTCSVHVAPSQ